MKRLYAGSDLLLRSLLVEALRERGIPYVVRNQFLAGAAGEIPPTECWPEVWVIEDRDLAPARRLLEALQRETRQHHDGAHAWRCPGCGECLGPAFDVCWRCGMERPEQQAACHED